MGKLTAIAVKAHLTTPGTYQDGEPPIVARPISGRRTIPGRGCDLWTLGENIVLAAPIPTVSDYLGFADAVVEAALAHKTPDAVQAAYRRTTYLGIKEQPDARVTLMDEWGLYCAGEAPDTE